MQHLRKLKSRELSFVVVGEVVLLVIVVVRVVVEDFVVVGVVDRVVVGDWVVVEDFVVIVVDFSGDILGSTSSTLHKQIY